MAGTARIGDGEPGTARSWRREDYGAWGADLGDTDFWRAVALLGMGAAAGALPQAGVDANAWLTELVAPWSTGAPGGFDDRAGVAWRIDEDLLHSARAGRVVDAAVLAASWPLVSASGLLPSRLVSGAVPNSAEHAAFAPDLRRATGLCVVYPLGGAAIGDDWQWPVRIALTDDTASIAPTSVDELTRITSPDADPAVEFLVLAGSPYDALKTVEAFAQPLRARVVLVCGRIGASGPAQGEGSVAAWLDELQRLTFCQGVVVIDQPPESIAVWLERLVRGLARDMPFDRAADAASDQAPMMHLASSVYTCSRIAHFADSVVHALMEAGDVPLDLGQDEAGPISLPPGRHTARTISVHLAAALRLPAAFAHERRAATWAVVLLRAAQRGAVLADARRRLDERLAPPLPTSRSVMRTPTATSDQRSVQVDVRAGGEQVRQFRRGTRHRIDVSIGSTDGHVSGPLFPLWMLPALPGEDAGHQLTVTLYAPGHLDQPVLRTVFLPRVGASTICSFEVGVGEDRPSFEARIAVAYRNRTLQTLLLRGGVLGVPGTSGQPIGLFNEMSTQVGWDGLDAQGAYGATIVLNKLGDDKGITLQSGYKVLGFTIPQLDAAIDQIESRIDKSDWAAADMQGVTGESSRKLLRDLTQYGSLLWGAVELHAKALADGETLLLNLQRAGMVQVMAANLGARLPIEFFYGNDIPDDDATICPRHAQALSPMGCAHCPHRDEQHFCPAGLWAMSKAIEWHHFDQAQARLAEFAPREFALQTTDVTMRRDRLRPITDIVLGASQQVGSVDAQCLPAMVDRITSIGVRVHSAASWDEVDAMLLQHRPGLLLLLPHTMRSRSGIECLEIGGHTRNVGQLRRMDLGAEPGTPGPVVMLLGCNTDNAGLQYRSFPVALSERAAIVVTAVSYLLGRHAAPLAARLVAAIVQAQRRGPDAAPPFSEVMLDARRDGMREDFPPLSLVLKSYGDARWRC